MKKMLVLLVVFVAVHEALLAQEYGVQLYTFRNQLSKDVPLDEVLRVKQEGLNERRVTQEVERVLNTPEIGNWMSLGDMCQERQRPATHLKKEHRR